MNIKSVSLKKINNSKLIIPNIRDRNKEDGTEYFPTPSPNIFIIAKKNSGKSTLIFNIIKSMIKPGLNVLLFSSTYLNDTTYQDAIIPMLNANKINYCAHTDIIDDDTKVNLLETFLRGTSNKEVGNNKYLIVFDDIGRSLRNPSVGKLLKTNRHRNVTTILSSQYPMDVLPETSQNLDYVILFKSIPESKLKKLYDNMNLELSFDLFLKMYKKITSEPYSFMYIKRIGNEEIRKNFDVAIEVKEEDEEED